MTATETSVVAWGGTRLPYAIRRSARRKKTVAVTVDPAGGVVLLAPELDSTVSPDQLHRNPQCELGEAPGGGEKTVARDRVLLRGTDDHSVFHLPESGVADPAGQIADVEERNESLFVLRRANWNGAQEKREQECCCES